MKTSRRPSASGTQALEWTDEELIRQAQRYDTRALTTIHERHFKPVYNYAFHRTNDSAVADDIASEVFVRFLESMRSKKPAPRSLRAWLLGVASHVIADHYRRAYRHETVKIEEIQHLPDTEADDPITLIENELQEEALREAIGQLTEAQQEVVALRFGSALSVKETAKAMGRTTGAIKLLQFRALASLRKWLNRDNGISGNTEDTVEVVADE